MERLCIDYVAWCGGKGSYRRWGYRGGRKRTEEEISSVEFRRAIRKVKEGKAAGTEYRGKFGSMRGGEWRFGYGNSVIGYGKVRDGRRIGRRDWWCRL